MIFLRKVWNSSVGCKLFMCLTGFVLVGFIIAHVAGNLLIFKGPEAINIYAKTLREYLPVLWFLRIGLLVSVLLHIASAIRLSFISRRARNVDYKKRTYLRSSLSSRTMMLSGFVVLGFIFYHLAHLTFRLTHPEFQNLGEYDVYSMLMISFKSPYVSVFYVISIVLLMMHLSHGLSSFFQTLGITTADHYGVIHKMGIAISTLLAFGFISVPAAIFLGFIQ